MRGGGVVILALYMHVYVLQYVINLTTDNKVTLKVLNCQIATIEIYYHIPFE